MKRFCTALLSLGLLLVFGTAAHAIDVKFSGNYFVAGIYESNHSLTEPRTLPSTAFYYQRLRLQTEFKVSDKLSLTTRIDALDRTWGSHTSQETMGAGTAVTEGPENIQFERAYISYESAIGMWMVGIQENGLWGTTFADTSNSMPVIIWAATTSGKAEGPIYIFWEIEKDGENSYPYTTKVTTGAENLGIAVNGNFSDLDWDAYYAGVFYKKDNIDTGLLYVYHRNAFPRQIPDTSQISLLGLLPPGTLGVLGINAAPFVAKFNVLDPYFKGKFGPIYIEAEYVYLFGKLDYEDDTPDQNIKNNLWYIGAEGDFGIAYVGAKAAYVSGDDPNTYDLEGGLADGGREFMPCLIMWNQDLVDRIGPLQGYADVDTANGVDNRVKSVMTNAKMYQGYFGVRPLKNLDIRASYTIAEVDKKPVKVTTTGTFPFTSTTRTTYVGDDYGKEADVTVTLKINDNLEYMAGFGYLWTGDYFKGASAANKVGNDYLILHRLSFSF
ncbi:MAG: hypothetical protein PHY31_02260 [Smithellaceae bacterium]|nr:hypothetical protein [Smithellaceae bacterium]